MDLKITAPAPAKYGGSASLHETIMIEIVYHQFFFKLLHELNKLNSFNGTVSSINKDGLLSFLT